MNVTEFVDLVQANAARVRQYQLGCDGSNGKCDCIGLIIGAVRMGGEKWPWTHGSNYTARYLVRGLGENQPLRLGDLVFKARAEGESGYALPDKYKNGADRRDYYHVGVVTQETPLVITHCTGVPGGIKRDSARGRWRYSGQLKTITGEQEETPMFEQATVIAENGKPVHVREQASTLSRIKTQLAVGTPVTILDDGGEWARIQYADKTGSIQTGYMMRKFLQTAQAEPPQGGTLYAQVMAARALLGEAQNKLNEASQTLEKLLAQK